MITVTLTSQPDAPYAHDMQARHHTLVSDVESALGGQDAGPSPHELALLGLGGCSAMTMLMYAKRAGIPVKKVTVTVTEGRIADPDDAKKQIPHIVEHFQFEGNLTSDQLTKLERFAKNCPVYNLMVGKKVIEAKATVVTPATAATPVAPAQEEADGNHQG